MSDNFRVSVLTSAPEKSKIFNFKYQETSFADHISTEQHRISAINTKVAVYCDAEQENSTKYRPERFLNGFSR